MDQQSTSDHTLDATVAAGITRREVLQRVTAILGGATLLNNDALLAFTFGEAGRRQATAGVGAFSAADIALLDEIAETILPETSTPGAKATKTGAFMALMVTATYSEPSQKAFRDGMRRLDEACHSAHNVSFMQATATQRLTLLEALDRQQRTAMEERAVAARSRAPAAVQTSDEPAHYFRMMKELALVGDFTSEIGCRQSQRYVESPGRFDPCVPYAPGEKAWAPHA